jgi:arginine exporter protein ArgO
MAKAMSEWIFIIVGLVVIAISIYFYDTLKIFIAIGGFMCLYGLGKMSYNKLKEEIFPKDEDEPVNLNKVPNPYMQKTTHATAQPLQKAQQHKVQHPQHAVHKQQVQQRQMPMQQRGKYCHACGKPVHPMHRFCSSCGSRLM